MEYPALPAILNPVLTRIRSLLADRARVLVAIDGRCGAGKTTLAAALQARLGCPVLPMDQFFLRPEQRTPNRLNEPGGNVDYERFFQEALCPLRQGVPFSYRPYDCRKGLFTEPVSIVPGSVTIVEGSYCCHPVLRDSYDLRIFLTVGPEEQLARILQRDGIRCAQRFAETWIPLEERYFSEAKTSACCELQFSTANADCVFPPSCYNGK